MRKLHELGRLAAATQLLPAMEGGEELLVGGQAVIEGVMMRSPHAFCVAVRKPSGEITTQTGPLARPSERNRIFRWPILRGLGTLGQALTLGMKALKFSADTAMEAASPSPDPSETGARAGQPARNAGSHPAPGPKGQMSNWLMAANIIFSVGFFIFFYKFVPLLLTTALKKQIPAVGNHFAFNAVDGVIRILLFLGFLALLSRWREIHRVFEYHGAEHKTVFNYESGRDVTVANARQFTTLHPRCGTSFLLVVMLISMVVYTLVPLDSFWLRFVTRIVMLPLIAGLSYELIRFAARHQGTLWSAMVAPGLWLQKITTQEPSDDQLETAIRALDEAMALEKQRGGELVIA